jgi:hypothetical protein
VAQRGERGSDVEVGSGRFGGGEVEAVDEDAEVTQEPLFVVGEEVVGPGDGLSQRAVTLIAEKVECLVEAGVEVLEGDRGHPRRRELDRQGHAVKAADDVGDGGELDRPRYELRVDLGGVVDEHGDGRGTGDALEVRGLRDRERGEPEPLLDG